MTDEEGYPNERMQLDDESIERTRDHNEKSHKIGKMANANRIITIRTGEERMIKNMQRMTRWGTCGKGKNNGETRK